MWKYIFSIAIAIHGGWAVAQEQQEPAEPEKVKKDFRPSMIKLSYDVVPLAASILYRGRAWQEGQVGVDFANYFLLAEFGAQQTERGGSAFTYENSGTYFRIGPEVNLLKNETNGNSLTFGIRYARARFSDRLHYTTPDTVVFGGLEIEAENDLVRSRWWELTLGLNVKVLKQFYLGYVIRYKVLNKNFGVGTLTPYDLPGFGLYEHINAVGFDYYISWVIPFRKKVKVPLEE